MITETITIGLLIVASGAAYAAWHFHNKNQELQNKMKQSQSELRSAQVKFGQQVENLLPCSKQFPEGKFIFLGQPVDGIIFGENDISFIEIKTGSSQLSGKQKKIKKLVEEGKTKFKEIRY